MRVNVNGKTGSKNSPSLDRFDPAKGYVVGSVVVVSNRANQIKGDSTAGEIRALVEWVSEVSA